MSEDETPQVLNLAELALVVELLDEQVFPTVHDGFGHHVFQPGVATNPTISLASSSVVAIGTVHMTCLPAFNAAIVCGA